MARIDTCWCGAAAPLSVTWGGQTIAIGLTLDADGWYAATETVCHRLGAALDASFPLLAWTVELETGLVFRLTASDTIDAALSPGFAAWLGLSTSYSGVTEIASASAVPCILDGQRIGVDLPVRYWHRTVVGDVAPVVWDSHWSWDVRWTRYEPDALATRPPRTPVALVFGDGLAPWALSNRDGYIVGRWSEDRVRRGALDAQCWDWGSWPLRLQWFGEV